MNQLALDNEYAELPTFQWNDGFLAKQYVIHILLGRHDYDNGKDYTWPLKAIIFVVILIGWDTFFFILFFAAAVLKTLERLNY